MNLLILVWNYLLARPLNTIINIVLLSLGIAVITILILFNNQLQEKITENVKGIDLVVGAKGSPLQLILCNIFHVDFPTGNIKLGEAERFARNRLIKQAIPLALGDSYNAFRIIGTNKEYGELYDAQLEKGNWFEKTLDVTIGSNVASITKLKIGDRFESSHGLVEGGHAHNEHRYVVTGTLKPTYSVLDNLILTKVESIWEMHDEHPAKEDHGQQEEHSREEHDHEHKDFTPSPLVPSVARGDTTKEITSMLILYRSPMAAIQLPRMINAESSLQAASPAFETARLFSILGVGADILMGFAYVLIIISALSIFIALYNSLKERRYDLAIMRSMGASRAKLFYSLLLEGGLLTVTGTVIGLVLGHSMIILLSSFINETQKAGISGIVFYDEEWIILAGSLLLGLICSFVPAIQAYKTDISKVLAGS